jgi:hypothetical protein
MFAVICNVPPTPQMKKASALMKKTESYLFRSSDPVGQYLERSLAAVRAVISVLAVTEGNSTGARTMIYTDQMRYALYERVYVWLVEHRGISEEALAAKYPDMAKRMQEEKEAMQQRPYSWAWESVSEPPYLLIGFLRHGRLSEVIAEVLHLTPE